MTCDSQRAGSAEDAMTLVTDLATRARRAQRALAGARTDVKNAALHAVADTLVAGCEAVLEANAQDVAAAQAEGMRPGLVDRLVLTSERVTAIADAVREVAALPDPVGRIIDGRRLPNGLQVRRVAVPLGVVGVIYEARPNVTVDVASLTLKSGNAVLLRGGHAAQRTNAVLIGLIRQALEACALPADLVATVDPAGRAGAQALMRARGYVDVLVPRGGAGLIRAVVDSSTVPVIETGAGNCHVYVDATADLEAAVAIIVNAKTQRVGVCNAAETLLVHRDVAQAYLPAAADALWARGVTLHADAAAHQVLAAHLAAVAGPAARQASAADGGEAAPSALPSQPLVEASEEDWATEYGSLDLAVRVVEDVDAATEHIRRWTTGHTEAVLAQDTRVIRAFIGGVDSAAVMVNASTRFTDGGQLGLGAELGISTQKLHARGPMGLEALTTQQWVVEGEGHVRP